MVPVIAGLAAEGALVSVDTHKPAVAEAAVRAGAAIVNDVSGLRDPALADGLRGVRRGAGDHAHARGAEGHAARPRPLRRRGRRRDRVPARADGRVALAAGVGEEQILLDPGPDFAKTPAQTVAVLRRLDAVLALGRPVLLAVSRKDFVGALTGRGPRERGAGTLAALAHGRRRRRARAARPRRRRGGRLPRRPRGPARRPRARARTRASRRTGIRSPASLSVERLPAAAHNAARCPPTDIRRKGTTCPPCLTAPGSRRARSPTSTCSPASSGSRTSAACARPT